MSSGSELILYLTLLLITSAMGLIVHAMLRFNKQCNDRITAIKLPLLPQDQDSLRAGDQKSTTLHGDIDVVHPKTGEKLRASARFRIKH